MVELSGSVYAVAVIRDYTERKKAEEALRLSEEKYRLLAENASDVIWSLDMNLNFTFISPSIERVQGWTIEEGKSLHLQDIMPPRSLETVMKVMEEEFALERMPGADKTRTRMLEIEEYRNDGSTIWMEITARFVRDEEGNPVGIMGIARDIADRRKAEEEKKRLEMQLFQAQKMESIGTLAGGIAHDFNNILSVIIGFSELAMANASDPEKMQRQLREVLNAGERAKDLVGQILIFSRKTETAYSPIALRTVIKESLKMMRSVIPTTIEIRQDLIDSGMVMSDLTQINQIIMNLCTNAAHAMGESGGVLEVGLKREDLDQNETVGLDVSPGPYMRLTVKDNGRGMPPEVMERIFDPYFTTKELGRGTGLGLSVVHGIVKSHKGAIICRSIPGEGTAFDVYLPEIESENTADGSSRRKPFPAGMERILFIDDEAALAGMANEMLSMLGYRVTVKTNSIEALDCFRERPYEFDLVITDMTMPVMTGDRMAQMIMEIRPDIPIILCTGYSDYISEDRARNIGIRAFLMKPLNMMNLAENIRSVLGEK